MLTAIGLVTVAIVGLYYLGRWLGDLDIFDPLEEPSKPSPIPDSADPCISLALRLSDAIAAARTARSLRDQGQKSISDLQTIRDVARAAELAAIVALGIILATQFFNPVAIGIATAVAVSASFALGVADQNLKNATEKQPDLERAVDAAEDAEARARTAFDDAECGSQIRDVET